MAAKRALRAVKSDDAPSPANGPSKSVSEAAKSGSHRELLTAMRERIAKAVSDPDCPPRDLAALTRRLQEIAKEIEVIDLRVKQEASEEGNVSDEAWDSSVI